MKGIDVFLKTMEELIDEKTIEKPTMSFEAQTKWAELNFDKLSSTIESEEAGHLQYFATLIVNLKTRLNNDNVYFEILKKILFLLSQISSMSIAENNFEFTSEDTNEFVYILLEAFKKEIDSYLSLYDYFEVNLLLLLNMAIERRDEKFVEFLILKNMQKLELANETDLLSYMIKDNYLIIAEYLINKLNSVQINQIDSCEKTPLAYAIEKGYLSIVELLVNKKAGLYKSDYLVDSYSITPLAYAIEKGHLSVVEFLIRNGADVNKVDYLENTPLIYAIKQESLDIVKCLITAKADLNATDKNGKTPLMHAVKREHLMFMNYLCNDGTRVSTPIVSYDRFNIVEILFNNGANLNATDKNRKTPLIYAIERERFMIEEFLPNKQGFFNVMDENGKNPLMRLLEIEHVRIVELLLNKGADIHAIDKNGKTPLMYAIERDYLEIVKLLVNKGADIHAIDKNGKTPLMYAKEKSFPCIVKYLEDQEATELHKIPKI